MPDWLRHFPAPRPQARVRLVCLPHAGGGASAFRAWPAELPSWLDVCALHLPGRESRIDERPPASCGEVATAVVDALDALPPAPCALFGHSLGAWLALEVARAMAGRGRPAPVRVFVSASPPPREAPRQPGLSRAPPEELLRYLHGLEGTPGEAVQNTELRELALAAVRTDLALAEGYVDRLEPRLTSPVSAFGGDSDPFVRPGVLGGWAAYTEGECSVRTFPGGHFYLRESRSEVLAAVTRLLGRGPAR